MVSLFVKEASVKVSFGFIFLIVGILGIARRGINAPQENLGHMIGTGAGIASLITLAAAFLSVGGLLILARIGSFSFEGSRVHARTDAGNTTPRLSAADVRAANENT
jgi:hypothetical protein